MPLHALLRRSLDKFRVMALGTWIFSIIHFCYCLEFFKLLPLDPPSTAIDNVMPELVPEPETFISKGMVQKIPHTDISKGSFLYLNDGDTVLV